MEHAEIGKSGTVKNVINALMEWHFLVSIVVAQGDDNGVIWRFFQKNWLNSFLSGQSYLNCVCYYAKTLGYGNPNK